MNKQTYAQTHCHTGARRHTNTHALTYKHIYMDIYLYISTLTGMFKPVILSFGINKAKMSLVRKLLKWRERIGRLFGLIAERKYIYDIIIMLP